ncbi:MAG: CBO0543 family protein [Bacillota bacterium]
MYFVLLFVLAWLWFFFKADKSRLRELFGAAVFASFLGLLTDLIMIHHKLWGYHGLPQPSYTIPLLLDFSVYPIVAYMFIQNLPTAWWDILKRTLFWTCFAGILEFITVKTSHMQYFQWWNIWLSLGSDIIIFLSIAGVYRFYRPAYVPSIRNSRL